MKPLVDFVAQGGPVMYAILLLSVVLYARCVKLLLSLRHSRQVARQCADQLRAQPAALRRLRTGVEESFRQQRIALGSMVAAAPLLGLLGTVGGMAKTFHGLADRGTGDSMGNLAHGISEVLVATESGLTVAIPALLLIAIAQRQMQKQLQALNKLEQSGLEALHP